ncbi:MAG: hypothetical protein ABIC95_03100 [archaeon]
MMAKPFKIHDDTLGGYLAAALIVLLGSIAGVILGASAFSNTSLIYSNATSIDYLRFDREGASLQDHLYGSESYMDNSVVNPNIMVDICHDNLTVGQYLDLHYMTLSANQTGSLLHYLPLVTSTFTRIIGNGTNTTNATCARVDVDLSSQYALFPGYVTAFLYQPAIVDINGTNTSTLLRYIGEKAHQFLNGSYQIGIRVDGPPKTYYLSIVDVYDEYGSEIAGRDRDYLFTSLVNRSNYTLNEARLRPGSTMAYTGSFRGGEMVYVNQIPSLEIKIYEPCGQINDSGYYIVNASVFNHNETCLTINNTDNLVVNFAGEIFDGDGAENGSFLNGTCPVIVTGSQNVTIEDLATQQFYYGICIENSSVTIFGRGASNNKIGAFIKTNSGVSLINVYFSNNETELISQNDSTVKFTNVSFTSADLMANFQDVIVKAVANPPPPPAIEGMMDIEQWIEFRAQDNSSYAQISFVYEEPLPNDVVVDNMSIYKFNGTYGVVNISWEEEVNGSNVTYSYLTTNWTGGNWTKLYTLISPSEALIIGPNVTNFSIFAPFGFEGEPQPEPEPEPSPDPSPSPGASPGQGGGGGGDSSGAEDTHVVEEPDAPFTPEHFRLNISLPSNISLQQGEPGIVEFNLTNFERFSIHNITILPRVPRGWDYTNASFDVLGGGNNTLGEFHIAPYLKTLPRDYIIPVDVLVTTNRTFKVSTTFIKVFVLPRGNLSRMKILEYPPVLQMGPNQVLNVTFLAENIGDVDLTNITIEFDETPCLVAIEGRNNLPWKETRLLSYTFEASAAGLCDYNLKFYSQDKLVGFAPISIIIKQKLTWQDQPLKMSALLLLLAVWSVITVFIITRRRKH